MHQVQKKAVLALVSMMEAGLREMRAILSDGTNVDMHVQSPRSPIHPFPGAPLDEREEAALDELMEKNREEMLRHGEGLAQRFYADAPDKVPGFFEEDDQ